MILKVLKTRLARIRTISSISFILSIFIHAFPYNGFTQDPPSLLSEYKFVASDALPNDQAGTTVAVSGNVAVIGAPNAWRSSLASMDPRGVAYVFRFNGSSWVQEQKLVASDAALSDRFGYSVSIEGDTILVGSWMDSDPIKGAASGSVYVFRYNGTSWIEAQKLTALDASANSLFGSTVSIGGNFAFIGSAGNAEAASNAGATYVFKKDGQNWVQTQKLLPVNAGVAEGFGQSISVKGNYAIVSASQDDSRNVNAGAVYVYHYNGTSWVQQTKLTASDALPYALFGYSVSLSDGVALIGAPKDYERGNMAGAAYVFRYNASNQQWVQEAKILDLTPQAPPSEAGNQFGYSVAISGNNAVITAPWWNDQATQFPIRDQGAAYLYTYNPANQQWSPQNRLLANGAVGFYDNMGKSLQVSDSKVIVGAPMHDAMGMDSGAAYVFSLSTPLTIASSSPRDGYIDPLEDRNAANQNTIYGIQNVSITFSTAVTAVGGGALGAPNFTTHCVRNSAAASDLQTGAVPTVVQVTGSGSGPYQLQLSSRICLGAWTEIKAINVVGPGNIPISSTGDRIVLGALPMDITQDGKILGDDINRWLAINGNSFDPVPLTKLQLLDQKRNGIVAGEDITRGIQLINGIGTFQVWSGFDLGAEP